MTDVALVRNSPRPLGLALARTRVTHAVERPVLGSRQGPGVSVSVHYLFACVCLTGNAAARRVFVIMPPARTSVAVETQAALRSSGRELQLSIPTAARHRLTVASHETPLRNSGIGVAL